jgi:hypothetical protein
MITGLIKADGRYIEELIIVFERNPEATIILVLVFWNLLDHVFGPKSRAVTPIARPFFLTPRVSNLAESDCLAHFTFYFLGSD